MSRLKELYTNEIMDAMTKKFGYKNVMQVPKLDGRGNYALGIKEQLIFPEVEYDKVDKVRGMDIIFVTTANTDEEARELLKLFNMPFAK